MKLSDLLTHIPNVLAAPDANPDITSGVSEDSRTVEAGAIFVARTGGSVDGHRFIAAAVAQGAAAVIGERGPDEVECAAPYVQVADAGLALAYVAAAQHDFPSRRLVLIGVTGTDGKTTTTNLIYSILKTAGLRAGMISTINAVLGDEEADTGLHVTTPTAPEVQAYLARMVAAGLTHCVLETTSHGLAQNRVAACEFDAAVITNIQHEHLDFHRTWEGYRDAKGKLFQNLMENASKTRVPGADMQKLSVVNLDDTNSADYLLAIPADRHLTYGVAEAAQVRAASVQHRADSTVIDIHLPGSERLSIETRLVGMFNVGNILAAVTLGYGMGLTSSVLKTGIEAVREVPGRMERVNAGQEFLAIVDFAHTPNALRVALETARTLISDAGRVVVVFGCAGLRDPEKRVLMGQWAARLADRTFITAEDPRTESLDDIMAVTAEAMTQEGGQEGETFWRVGDRGEAIFRAVQMAQPDDIVIVCGKGHEQSMAFGTEEYAWDDRVAMRHALAGEPQRTLPTAAQ